MRSNLIRIFDILISILTLLISLPFIILVSFLIFAFDGKPIIFKQNRVGQYGKNFKILKFRTMKNVKKKNEIVRLTKVGIILRKLSFDEIPQFINILKNEMSVVGPRPLPSKYERKIIKSFRKKRRQVLPGLTGLSQINYKGKKRTLNDKVKLDVKFVENYSFIIYSKIIIKTPIVLLIRLLKNKTSIIK